MTLDHGAEQQQLINADKKSVDLDGLNVKINRLNRYIAQAERRMAGYQKEMAKGHSKLRDERDFAAKHLDSSATIRREA